MLLRATAAPPTSTTGPRRETGPDLAIQPTARYRRLLAMALLPALLLACGPRVDVPRTVTLADLVVDQELHDGSVVTTEGIVRTYDEPRHYWIEDAEQHRVELFPHEGGEDLVGQTVRVTGRFTFREDRGRAIDIDDLEVLDAPPTATGSPVGDPGTPGLAGVVGHL